MMLLSDYSYDTWIVKSRIRKEMQLLDAEIAGVNGRIVLDAGSSASDYFMKEYAARELKTVSMDISMSNLSAARSKPRCADVSLLAGDVNNIPLATESVDIVFLCELLEHLNTPEQALQEAHRVLRKGGYVVIDVPWLHQVYRPLSAMALRSLHALRNGRLPLSLRLLFNNLDDIATLDSATMLKRTWFGSLLIRMLRVFPTFRRLDPESFILAHYRGVVPEGDMHLQFRFPAEWCQLVQQSGFEVLRKTGAQVTPCLFDRSRLCNLLCSKLELRMADSILLRQSQILIIMATKA